MINRQQLDVQRNGNGNGRLRRKTGTKLVLLAIFHLVNGEQFYPVVFYTKYNWLEELCWLLSEISALIKRMFRDTPTSMTVINLGNFADVIVCINNHGLMQDDIWHKHAQCSNGLEMKCKEFNNLAGRWQFLAWDLAENKLYDVKDLSKKLTALIARKAFGNTLQGFAGVVYRYYKIHMRMRIMGHRIDSANKSDIYLYSRSDYWHAFIFPDDERKYSKDDILEGFSNSLPSVLSEVYPCYYQYSRSNGEHKFLMRKCFKQIRYLVEECNLELRLTFSSRNTSKRIHRLRYYLIMDDQRYHVGQINPIEAIREAIDMRFNRTNRSLNLNKFSITRGLENIALNMQRTKILSRVLTLASKGVLMHCVELDLAYNNIKTLRISKNLPLLANLKIIDLGFNCIRSLDGIRDLSLLRISCLRLDGNPLCRQYGLSRYYVKQVKLMFPQLAVLDNVRVASVCQCTWSQKNFLHMRQYYDFVGQFVPRFYKLFEGSNRLKLLKLYDKNSMFTLTYRNQQKPATTNRSQQLEGCRKLARNIIQQDTQTPRASKVYYGRDVIMKCFQIMPHVSFDALSFTTDALEVNKLFIITVTGVFLCQDPTLQYYIDKLMAFSRTLVIRPPSNATKLDITNECFRIINDQMNLYEASDKQIQRSLCYPKALV